MHTACGTEVRPRSDQRCRVTLDIAPIGLPVAAGLWQCSQRCSHPKCPYGYVSRETGLNTSVIPIHSRPYRINATKDQAWRRGEPAARHRWIRGMD